MATVNDDSLAPGHDCRITISQLTEVSLALADNREQWDSHFGKALRKGAASTESLRVHLQTWAGAYGPEPDFEPVGELRIPADPLGNLVGIFERPPEARQTLADGGARAALERGPIDCLKRFAVGAHRDYGPSPLRPV